MQGLLAHLPRDPVARGIVLNNLAAERSRQGRLCEAYALACRGFSLLRSQLDLRHPCLRAAASNLALLTARLAESGPQPSLSS